MPVSSSPNSSEAMREPEAHHPAPVEIDRQALAEKVFALLKRELRIERERRGDTRPPPPAR